MVLRRSWGQPERCNGAWDVGVLGYDMSLQWGMCESGECFISGVAEVGDWPLHFRLNAPKVPYAKVTHTLDT